MGLLRASGFPLEDFDDGSIRRLTGNCGPIGCQFLLAQQRQVFTGEL
jgi:hypothetical protein